MTRSRAARVLVLTSAVTAASLLAATAAHAAGTPLVAGDLLVSTSTYPTTPPAITAGTTQLPPGCGAANDPCATAVAGGAYPQVFNNISVDPAFGVTSPIVLDQLTTAGTLVNQTVVPNSTQTGVTGSSDQLVTSFSSKSELALNQATDDGSVSFFGYEAPVGAIDVSNTNTPGAVDATNPDTGTNYRSIAQLTDAGGFSFTNTNVYSGNNGRAAILDAATGRYFAVGNGGNGSNPEPQGVVQGTGLQLVGEATGSQASQTPGATTPLGSFNVTQLGGAADKSAKDDNFRGVTVSNGVVYVTKDSGSNGVDTVYFLDTTGTACTNGVGVPAAGAALPTAATTLPAYSTSNTALGLTTKNPGLAPENLCILRGFPTTLASSSSATDFPSAIWFASPTTAYVADEGSGTNTYSATTGTYTAAAASTTAGLQKWVLNTTTQTWSLAYTLQSGLNLGQPYTVAGYPTGTNSGAGGTNLPWAPANDGLRNLAGHVNPDGSVTLWASTATVSGSGDQGGDPNALVSITDQPAAAAPAVGEAFQTAVAPTSGTVVRGVTYLLAAGSPAPALPELPWLPLAPLSAVVVGGAVLARRRRARV